MSEENVSKTTALSVEQAEQVGGGCTAEQIYQISQNLTNAYENLVDFVSHVIERVSGK